MQEEFESKKEIMQSLVAGLNSAGIGISIVNSDYQILFQNKVLKERRGEPNNKLCYELYRGENKPCKICPVKSAIEDNLVSETEIKADSEVYYRVIAAPIPNPSGIVDRAIEIVIDITERKMAENAIREERNKAHLYIDIAGVMIVALNTRGDVTLINKKGCEILGYKEWEIIGKNWFDNFVPARISAEILPVSKRLLGGETKFVEYYENPVLTKSGRERIIAWHNAVIKDDVGRIIGTLSSGQEIT
jgi:PAS domain S-box-containing protein